MYNTIYFTGQNAYRKKIQILILSICLTDELKFRVGRVFLRKCFLSPVPLLNYNSEYVNRRKLAKQIQGVYSPPFSSSNFSAIQNNHMQATQDAWNIWLEKCQLLFPFSSVILLVYWKPIMNTWQWKMFKQSGYMSSNINLSERKICVFDPAAREEGSKNISVVVT